MRTWSLPLLLGGVAVLVGAAFSWVPSFWWDEAATISAANRPFADMLELHSGYDAVHALHNLLLHGWFSLVGISEFTARIPGAVALGVGAAAVTATGQMLAGRRVGFAAGVLFAVLPRVTWAATEARSYAFTIACAAVLSFLLVLALKTRRGGWWAAYAVMVAVSTVMFVYSALLVVAHVVTVVAVARGRDRIRFLVAAAVGAALAVPFVLLAYSQMRQVSWIPSLDGTVVHTILVDQWFPRAPWAAALSAVIVVAGSLVAARRGVSAGEKTLLWVAVPGCTVPIAVVLARSLVSSNMYLDRYVSFTVPSMVLVVGWALARLAPRRWSTVVVLAAVTATVAPAYVSQRQPFGKAGGMDYSVAADRLLALSQPGECLAFEPKASWNPTTTRALADARPDLAVHLRDVGLGRSAADRDDLWSSDVPPHELAQRAVAQCDVLWVIADRDRDTEWRLRNPTNEWWTFAPYRFTETDTYRELAAVGFTVADREPVHRLQLIRLERGQTQ